MRVSLCVDHTTIKLTQKEKHLLVLHFNANRTFQKERNGLKGKCDMNTLELHRKFHLTVFHTRLPSLLYLSLIHI